MADTVGNSTVSKLNEPVNLLTSVVNRQVLRIMLHIFPDALNTLTFVQLFFYQEHFLSLEHLYAITLYSLLLLAISMNSVNTERVKIDEKSFLSHCASVGIGLLAYMFIEKVSM